MRRILIAIDGSPHSDVTLHLGSQIAELSGGKVSLLTSVFRRVTAEEAGDILERARLYMREQGVEVDVILGQGNPARAILHEARRGNFGLIILGFRAEEELDLRPLGSTVDRVLAHIPCPILITNRERGDLRRILVCDSGVVEPTLFERFTERLWRLVGPEAQVTILHVMSQMSAGPGVRGWQLRAEADELIEAHTPEGELLEHDIEELEEHDVQPRVIVRHGWVVDEIADEAKQGDYGLVVIGAHRTEGWRRFLLDDLARQIILQCDRPVLVVK